MLKILIADDHPLFREAVRNVVAGIMAARDWAYVCQEATDTRALFAAVEQDEDLDLILLDLYMPGSNGLADLVALRDKVPGTPILVISSASDPAVIRQAITCGAAGFVPKSASTEQLQRALLDVLAGGVHFPGQDVPPVPAHRRTDDWSGNDHGNGPLTGRQIAVLALLAKGKSNKQIANELNISENTVKAHMTSILRKLGVSTRAQAIVTFQRAEPGHLLNETVSAARQAGGR
jgi:DNA-binding NarL/FixJ family response regulator